MVKGMGESCFDDLLPWLMVTLASEQSSVDRSGAAQGGFLTPHSPVVSDWLLHLMTHWIMCALCLQVWLRSWLDSEWRNWTS